MKMSTQKSRGNIVASNFDEALGWILDQIRTDELFGRNLQERKTNWLIDVGNEVLLPGLWKLWGIPST